MSQDPFASASRTGPPLMARRALLCWPFALALAACSSSLGAADIEQAGPCGDLHAARPAMQVRNLSCRPAAGDRAACDYEATTGTGPAAWVRVRGEFRRYSGTGAWCFDTRPAGLPGEVAR